MQILSREIKKPELLNSECIFEDGPMIKGVVDVSKKLVAIDSELHADLEEFLLENGSNQEDLWGINLYPNDEEDFIEFDSMINIRPRQGNRSRDIEDPSIRAKIVEIINGWIK